MEQWYIAGPGAEPEGPLSTEELVKKIRRGGVDGEVKVCPATGSVWVALADVPQFSRALRRAPTMMKLPSAASIAAATASAARSRAAAPAAPAPAAPAPAAAASGPGPAQAPIRAPSSGRPPPGPNRMQMAAAAHASAPPAARAPAPPAARVSAPPTARVSAPPVSGPVAIAPEPKGAGPSNPPEGDGDATPRRPSRGHTPFAPATGIGAAEPGHGVPLAPFASAPSSTGIPYWVPAGVGGFLMLMGAGATFAGLEHRGLAVMLLGLAVMVVAGRPRD